MSRALAPIFKFSELVIIKGSDNRSVRRPGKYTIDGYAPDPLEYVSNMRFLKEKRTMWYDPTLTLAQYRKHLVDWMYRTKSSPGLFLGNLVPRLPCLYNWADEERVMYENTDWRRDYLPKEWTQGYVGMGDLIRTIHQARFTFKELRGDFLYPYANLSREARHFNDNVILHYYVNFRLNMNDERAEEWGTCSTKMLYAYPPMLSRLHWVRTFWRHIHTVAGRPQPYLIRTTSPDDFPARSDF